jgi:hypothetical protein
VARGLPAGQPATTLKKLYDLNGAVGGPIKQDRAWFYVTSRYFTNEYFLAGRFYRPTPRRSSVTNDRHVRAYAGTYTYDNNGRVTVALSRSRRSRLVRVSVQG